MALNITFKGYSTIDNNSKNYQLYDEALIKRDLLNSFMERPNERVMLGKRGCKIWNMLFEGINFVQQSILDEVVRIVKMENRVVLLDTNLVIIPYGVQVQITIQFNQLATVDTLYIDFENNANDSAN